MTKKTSIDKITMGPEPMPSGPFYHEKDIRLSKFFTWYNYFYTVKEGRAWIVKWMKLNKYAASKIATFDKASDHKITMSSCSLARMLLNGAELNEYLLNRLKSQIDAAIASVPVQRKRKTVAVVQQPTPVDRLREKCNELLSEVEYELDELYRNGYVSKFSMYDFLKAADVKPAAAKYLKGAYDALLQEIDLVIKKKDKDLVEGYEKLKKKQLTDYFKFVKMLVDDTEKYFTNTSIAKPRKVRKSKPIDHQAMLKTFTYKQEDKELKLVSFPPVQIFDATSIWIYNCKYKKLTVLHAEDGKKLSVRGTTVVNVDLSKSTSKTIRKPTETIKSLMDSGKVPLRTFMDKLTTKPIEATGRINEETILLRCIK